MAKRAGRSLILKKAGTAIAGVKALGWKLDATPIDVMDNDSAGLQEFLAGAAAKKMLTIDVSGILNDNVLRALAIAPGTDLLLTDISFEDPGAPAPGDIISGNFYMTNFQEGGETENAVTFRARA